MKKDLKPLASLAEVEREVLAECREWGPRRLEQRLQQLADQTGEVSPLRQRKRRPLTLRTELGRVKLIVAYGQDPHTQQWFCPHTKLGFVSPPTATPRLPPSLKRPWGRARRHPFL